MKRFAGPVSSRRAELALVFVTLLWAGTFPLIKIGVADASPLAFVAVRFGVAALLFYPFARRALRGMDSRAFRDGVLLGVLFFLGYAFQTLGLKYTTASKSAFITGSFVVFTPIFQALLRKKPPLLANVFGVAFVFVGVLFLSSEGETIGESLRRVGEGFNIGDFYTLLCAVAYSLYIVVLDAVGERHSVRLLTFMQIGTTLVLAVVVGAALHATGIETARLEPTRSLVLVFFYTGALATVVTTLLQTRFQRYVTPTKAGILFSLEPVFASALAWATLGDKYAPLGIVGAALIFVGLIISETFGSETKREDDDHDERIAESRD
jgi:drug/metabolite transporter (DMT)-like permease